jgi:hypothetical protein
VSRLDSTDRPAAVSTKWKPDIYFMMLVLSFLALVIGSICLFLEVKSYDLDIKAKGAQVRAWERSAFGASIDRALAAGNPTAVSESFTA